MDLRRLLNNPPSPPPCNPPPSPTPEQTTAGARPQEPLAAPIYPLTPPSSDGVCPNLKFQNYGVGPSGPRQIGTQGQPPAPDTSAGTTHDPPLCRRPSRVLTLKQGIRFPHIQVTSLNDQNQVCRAEGVIRNRLIRGPYQTAPGAGAGSGFMGRITGLVRSGCRSRRRNRGGLALGSTV